jgi:Cu(I)/Ag(I) efflux system membrane fusion protein
MPGKFIARAAALAVAAAALLGACGRDGGYRFEAVDDAVRVGEARIEARLVGPDGAAVPMESVSLIEARLDMGPDGMAKMAAPLKTVASDDPNVLAFETDFTMAGRWALRLKAKVDGKAVEDVVVFTATQEEADAAAGGGGDRKILYYRNPMGLPDVSPVPKKDPMGMDYVPVYADEIGEPGTVRISPQKVQLAGVRTAPVERRLLVREVRGAGMIEAAESRLAVIAAKFDGFVERLDVRTTGESVRKGQTLMTAWVESEELLNKMADLASVAGDPQLDRIARRNLRQFDVPESEIARIAKNGGSFRSFAFVAPFDGTVLQKPAVDGMRFSSGETLFRIADLSTLWADVEISEQDIPFVKAGQRASLTLPALPGETFEGIVDFVYPELVMETRSGRARIVVPNEDNRLRLGLFARVEIEATASSERALIVPRSAIIDDGERQIAFVAKGDGAFEPRDLELGARAGEFVEVRKGLAEGEEIVVSGTFLIDAESNLQSALRAFTTGPES